jgi:hypothetical protein
MADSIILAIAKVFSQEIVHCQIGLVLEPVGFIDVPSDYSRRCISSDAPKTGQPGAHLVIARFWRVESQLSGGVFQ